MNKTGDSKVESNDSPEIPDRRETSDIPGLPSGATTKDYIRLRETFIKRYIVERTNKAEIRPEEQSEKAESCWGNLWNEIRLKVP